MKKVLIPLIAGAIIGGLCGLILLMYEFSGVEEIFINYKP